MTTLNFVINLFFSLVILGALYIAAYGIYYLWRAISNTRLDLEHKRVTVKIANLNTSLVYPSHDGVLPIARAAIDSQAFVDQTLALLEQKIQTLMPVQPVPTTYSPNLSTSHILPRGRGGDYTVVKPEQIEQKPTVLEIPDFLSLWKNDELPHNKFLLGYDLKEQKAIYATWKMLYSSLVGGESGSGKSTLVRLILAQSALQGGKFVVIDPHFNSGEESLGASLMPLQNYMHFQPAHTTKEYIDSLLYVNQIGQARLDGNNDRTPLILVVDETTALLQSSDVSGRLQETLRFIALQTRKVGVFAMCIGQQWTSEIISTTVRDSFVSHLSCHARKNVGRIMSGNTIFGKITETLTVGQAVWLNTKTGLIPFQIPNTTDYHIQQLAKGLIEDKSKVSYSVANNGYLSQNNSGGNVAYPEETTAYRVLSGDNYTKENKPFVSQDELLHATDISQNKTLSDDLFTVNKPETDVNKPPISQKSDFTARELRILELQDAGKTNKEIITELSGKELTGAPYTAACNEIAEVNRKVYRLTIKK